MEGAIVGPILEEVMFRGALLGGLKACQYGYNKIRYCINKYEPSETDLKVQEIFRVRVSALIFGVVHFTNYPTVTAFAVFHVSTCILGGLTYGYMAEKTNSVILPIFLHSFFNASLEIGEYIPALEIPCDFLALGSDLFWYWYATRETANSP